MHTIYLFKTSIKFVRLCEYALRFCNTIALENEFFDMFFFDICVSHTYKYIDINMYYVYALYAKWSIDRMIRIHMGRLRLLVVSDSIRESTKKHGVLFPVQTYVCAL